MADSGTLSIECDTCDDVGCIGCCAICYDNDICDVLLYDCKHSKRFCIRCTLKLFMDGHMCAICRSKPIVKGIISFNETFILVNNKDQVIVFAPWGCFESYIFQNGLVSYFPITSIEAIKFNVGTFTQEFTILADEPTEAFYDLLNDQPKCLDDTRSGRAMFFSLLKEKIIITMCTLWGVPVDAAKYVAICRSY